MTWQLLYWHWIVFGVGLAVLEIFLPNFVVLWFGLGAVIVGLVLWAVPALPLGAQLGTWLVASSTMAWLWFRYFKPRMVDRTKAGIAREALIGQSGQVLQAPGDGRRGRARFSVPVLGSDEWEIRCEEPLAPGDRIFIREFSGNTLIVTKTP
jgi:inner membrane protein